MSLYKRETSVAADTEVYNVLIVLFLYPSFQPMKINSQNIKRWAISHILLQDVHQPNSTTLTTLSFAFSIALPFSQTCTDPLPPPTQLGSLLHLLPLNRVLRRRARRSQAFGLALLSVLSNLLASYPSHKAQSLSSCM